MMLHALGEISIFGRKANKVVCSFDSACTLNSGSDKDDPSHNSVIILYFYLWNTVTHHLFKHYEVL